jgi:hypothetical protein
MIFLEMFFKNIEYKILNNSNTVFYLDFFQLQILGGQKTIIKDHYNIPSGLKSYNNFFNKNYTIEDLITNKMIVGNTFLIPKKCMKK